MKNLLLFVFSFLTLNLNAQTKEMHSISFGGLTNGSTTSIMQLLDYPTFLISDKEYIVVSYEISILEKGASADKVKKLAVTGASLSSEAKDVLKSLQNKEGKMTISKVMTKKGDISFETPYFLELSFDH